MIIPFAHHKNSFTSKYLNGACLLLFFFFFFNHSSLYAQRALDKKIDFSLQDESIPDGLWRLSETTDIPIIFSDVFFYGHKNVSVSFQNKPIKEILETLLSTTPTAYEFDGQQILILKKEVPKRYTISGYLEDKESGERLIGANIFDLQSKKGTVSNTYGFFSLTLLEGEKTIVFSYLGYQAITKYVNHSKHQQLNIQLTPNLTLTEVVVIDSSLYNETFHTDVGEKITPANVAFLSPLGGTPDILRAVQQLPGVQSGVDGFGGLHVRGGNADQNLVLFDGVRIYNPFHAIGLFSIFDNNMVRKVNYYRGQFPARFGGRISSVVDVRTKEGNNKEFHAQTSIGLIDSKLTLEGPLKREKGAFLFSARRTHLDPFIKSYSRNNYADDQESGFFNYYFGEVIGKMNYALSPKDQLYLSFYYGTDDYKNENQTTETYENPFAFVKTDIRQGLDWGNTLGVFRWNHQMGNKLFLNATLDYSLFQFKSNDIYQAEVEEQGILPYLYSQKTAYQSRIDKQSIKLDFQYVPQPEHFIRTGIMISRQKFSPGITHLHDTINDDEFDDTLLDSLLPPNNIQAHEFSFYIEDEWHISPNLYANLGLYNALFSVRGKNYTSIEPRVSLSWNMNPRLTWQVSASKTGQFIHVLTTSGAGLPNDLWVPSTENVKPQRAWIYDLGWALRIGKNWQLENDVYYKKMKRLLSYREGESLFSTPGLLTAVDWETRVTSGEGTSYGTEWALKKTRGRNQLWVTYTWSKTIRQFDEINKGKSYPYRFDLRHVLNINASRLLNEKWTASFSWNYNSGSKISLPIRNWEYVNQQGNIVSNYIEYSPIGSYQLPSYHQLDIRCQYKEQKTWGEWSILLGVYNVYNRKNLLHIIADYDIFTNEQKYLGVSLIPILPYFSFSIKI